MRSPEFDPAPVLLIMLFGVVLTAALGLLVVLPTAFIEWSWNLFASSSALVPQIGTGQAFLLYIALGLLFYILGLVKIEFKVEKLENFDKFDKFDPW